MKKHGINGPLTSPRVARRVVVWRVVFRRVVARSVVARRVVPKTHIDVSISVLRTLEISWEGNSVVVNRRRILE